MRNTSLWRKNKILLFVLIGFIIVCSFSIVVVKNVSQQISVSYSQQQPGRLAIKFSDLIMNNNRLAARLAANDLEPQIVSWIDSHEVAQCRLSLEHFGEYYSSAYPVSISNNELRAYNVRIPRYCANSDKWLCFKIDNIVLEKEGNKWVVLQLGDIREEYTLLCHTEE